MTARTCRSTSCLAVVAVLLAGSALVVPEAPLAAQISPAGPDFQVNSYTTNFQLSPSITSLGDAGFVVVWSSLGSAGSDNDQNSVQAQRFNRSGLPLAGQFQVNTYTTGRQFQADVDADAAGNFVVVWTSDGSAGTDTLGASVQARRYAPDGTPLTGEFQVNSYTTNNQSTPAVAVNESGEAIIVWGSLGSVGDDPAHSIQGQLYNAAGAPAGSQFQVNSYTTGEVSDPFATFLTTGDFAVVFRGWGSTGGDTDQSSIQARIFDSSASPIAAQFQVNSYTPSYQFAADVAGVDANNFVVVWEGYGSSETDADGSSIQARLIDGAGVPLTGEFQINQYTTSYQDRPSVSADGGGDFVVVWDSQGSAFQDADLGSIQGRRYSAGGGAMTAQFEVNSHIPGDQGSAFVDVDPSGNFIVAWHSSTSTGTDSSNSSIQARRFDDLFRDGFESSDSGRWSATVP